MDSGFQRRIVLQSVFFWWSDIVAEKVVITVVYETFLQDLFRVVGSLRQLAFDLAMLFDLDRGGLGQDGLVDLECIF